MKLPFNHAFPKDTPTDTPDASLLVLLMSYAVRDAYKKAEYLVERRTMMQQYADMLDGLAKGAKIVPFQGKRAART